MVLPFVLTRFPDICSRFHGFVVKRGHYSLRVWIADERVLGPSLDSRLGGFIERHCIELRGENGRWSELKAFVDAGLKRERILLDRRADEQRAQQLSENQRDWLAEMPGYEQLAREELGIFAEDAAAIFREFDVISER